MLLEPVNPMEEHGVAEWNTNGHMFPFQRNQAGQCGTSSVLASCSIPVDLSMISSHHTAQCVCGQLYTAHC